MTATELYRSVYKADLTPQERKWADETAKTCKRTDYYNLTKDEVRIVNEWTREKIVFGLFTLDWQGVMDRLGLILAPVTIEYVKDDNGVVKVDAEGKDMVESTTYDKVKFSATVKAIGLKDYAGNIIEKGKQQFAYSKQATNRPLVESNWKQNVLPRIPKWMINGETLIKDSNEAGISEQHTCVARAVQILEAKDGITPTDSTMQKFYIDGIHPLASITADTGKANTGADIFGSDPEIVPVDIIETFHSYQSPEDSVILHKNPIERRTKLCNTVQASAKLIMLRCGAKDVNASLGNGQAATRDAHILTTRIMPDLDDLATMVTEYISTMGFRTTPISATHLTTALAMWYLKDHDAINTCPRKNVPAFDGGTPLGETAQIRFDLELVKPFLLDLRDSNSETKIAKWTTARLGKKNLKPNEKFGQVVRLIMAYFDEGLDITATLLNSTDPAPKGCGVPTKTGQPDAKNYLHFGGADRGPWLKPAKEEVEEVAA